MLKGEELHCAHVMCTYLNCDVQGQACTCMRMQPILPGCSLSVFACGWVREWELACLCLYVCPFSAQPSLATSAPCNTHAGHVRACPPPTPTPPSCCSSCVTGETPKVATASPINGRDFALFIDANTTKTWSQAQQSVSGALTICYSCRLARAHAHILTRAHTQCPLPPFCLAPAVRLGPLWLACCVTWQCVSDFGGSLATFKSDADFQAVVAGFFSTPAYMAWVTPYVWIGLYDAATYSGDGDWRWVDGTDFPGLKSAASWLPGEPRNGSYVGGSEMGHGTRKGEGLGGNVGGTCNGASCMRRASSRYVHTVRCDRAP